MLKVFMLQRKKEAAAGTFEGRQTDGRRDRHIVLVKSKL